MENSERPKKFLDRFPQKVVAALTALIGFLFVINGTGEAIKIVGVMLMMLGGWGFLWLLRKR